MAEGSVAHWRRPGLAGLRYGLSRNGLIGGLLDELLHKGGWLLL